MTGGQGGPLGEWHHFVRHLPRCGHWNALIMGRLLGGRRASFHRPGSLCGFIIQSFNCVCPNIPIPYAKVPYLSHNAPALVQGTRQRWASTLCYSPATLTTRPCTLYSTICILWLQKLRLLQNYPSWFLILFPVLSRIFTTFNFSFSLYILTTTENSLLLYNHHFCHKQSSTTTSWWPSALSCFHTLSTSDWVVGCHAPDYQCSTRPHTTLSIFSQSVRATW